MYLLTTNNINEFGNPDNKTLVGIFLADNKKTYSFYIDKSNPLPQLKPTQS